MTIKELKLNDIGLKALLAFIFFVPISYFIPVNLGFQTLRIIQEQCFQIGIIILFALVLENIYLAAFLILSVILYVFHNYSGGNYLTNIFYGCILYQISYNMIDRNNLERIFKILLWLCFANAVWMILQFIGWELIFLQFTTKSYIGPNIGMGFMGLKCFMGMFFVLMLPIALYFNPFLGVLFIIPIYLSESSISFIAYGVILLVEIIRKIGFSKKIAIILSLIVILLSAAYTYKDSKANMMTDRFNLWKVCLRDAFKQPITGWGMDSFRNISSNGKKDFNYFKSTIDNKSVHGIFVPETKSFMLPKSVDIKDNHIDPWDNAHNEYVQLFFEFGVFGIMILFFLMTDVIKRLNTAIIKNTNKEMVITLSLIFLAYLIIGIAQFPLHVVRNGIFFPILLGAYYKLTERNKTEEI